MRKKDYEKPTMRVVEIQQRTTLLTISTNTSTQLKVTYTEENWDEE